MNDTEADATVEITLHEGSDLQGEDLRFLGTTFVADVAIDPGFPGSGSMYTAASDIDFYGQEPSYADVFNVRVRENGSDREATKEEQEAFLRWVDAHDEQFNAAAVEAWGGPEEETD
jgi:hypothetical protein